eukprot:CAMPEP_0183539094 /NCGR_PEP_ID=MMETSP0371-20130417/30028_1 /TAXON_ID=268820 /ORGANISM="Peridinium aciculiferum, Strain PAER-2" /LENGTH=97 /DNA_ID=CAMNT_0025740001 /DNA_START=190 /DNA_END=483 /DNA_ORIENTATION=+
MPTNGCSPARAMPVHARTARNSKSRLWLYKSYLGDLCRAALHRDARPTVQAYRGIPQYRSPYMDMRQHAAWAKLTLNLSHATQLGKPKPCCMDKAFL